MSLAAVFAAHCDWVCSEHVKCVRSLIRRLNHVEQSRANGSVEGAGGNAPVEASKLPIGTATAAAAAPPSAESMEASTETRVADDEWLPERAQKRQRKRQKGRPVLSRLEEELARDLRQRFGRAATLDALYMRRAEVMAALHGAQRY